MAGGAAAAMIGAGVWLYDGRGRTQAALACLSAGLAAMFATVVVAAQVYELVPAPLALAGALATGALALWLAVRWEAKGIAALGILGAMLSPALAGAGVTGTTIAALWVAGACAVAVLVSQRWRWLSVGTVALTVPQWAYWLATTDAGPLRIALVLGAYAVLGGAAALGHELREDDGRLEPLSAGLLALNGFAIATGGWLAIGAAGHHDAGCVFLWALAAGHALAALGASRHVRAPRDLVLLLLTSSALLADVAWALTVDGPARTIGWAAAGVAFAVAMRRRGEAGTGDLLATTGLGGHLALALLQLLLTARGFGAVDTGALVAVAAACFASSRIAEHGDRLLRVALDVTGLLLVGWLTAITLGGTALVLAYAGEAVALSAVARRTDDRVAAAGGLTALGLALGLALGFAPPRALAYGIAEPLDAVAGVGGVAAATVLTARARILGPARPWLLGLAAVTLLYLASALLVTPFQPDGAAAGSEAFSLLVRQQGQALLSALWALAGAGAVVLGLVRDRRALRLGGLVLVGAAIAKVGFVDLSQLDSVYRVASFVALGVLLLVTAFVWQRIRPAAVPDLRETPPALR
jgi:hypothetical protein